jgi:hypothetical protein
MPLARLTKFPRGLRAPVGDELVYQRHTFRYASPMDRLNLPDRAILRIHADLLTFPLKEYVIAYT